MGIEQLKVEYVDHSGSDLSVVNAARVSFDKRSEALGYVGVEGKPMTPVIHDVDKKLIKYLADHEHYSPFNHAFVTFRCSAPLFVMGQLKKHEYMPWNEISRRYINSEPEFYRPDDWRERNEDKKQGSSDKTVKSLQWTEIDTELHTDEHPMWEFWDESITEYTDFIYGEVAELYQRMIENDVCPEQARMVLPQSMMSSWIWSGTIKAVAKMCKLRCKPDTQYETRVIANLISKEMEELYPTSWAALMGKQYPFIRPMSRDERTRATERKESNGLSDFPIVN